MVRFVIDGTFRDKTFCLIIISTYSELPSYPSQTDPPNPMTLRVLLTQALLILLALSPVSHATPRNCLSVYCLSRTPTLFFEMVVFSRSLFEKHRKKLIGMDRTYFNRFQSFSRFC